MSIVVDKYVRCVSNGIDGLILLFMMYQSSNLYALSNELDDFLLSLSVPCIISFIRVIRGEPGAA